MNSNWKFYKGTNENAFASNFDDSGWESVTLPHTWNNIDGQDGCVGGKDIRDTDYFRGDGWYRKNIKADDSESLYFLRFEGANTVTDVYVNGSFVGEHKGGYTAFSFDITPYLNFNNDNVIAVKVNNECTGEVAPITADFTFYGGIYRGVELIKKNKVHFDFGEFATRGIKITTPSVSDKKAVCVIESVIKNETDSPAEVTVNAVLSSPAEFIKNTYIKSIDFDIKNVTDGKIKLTDSKKYLLEPHSSEKVSFTFEISNPHLWNGRRDPYLYKATLSTDTDTVSDTFGLRYFSVDREKGFFLNGKSYPLRGVSRHQDREGLGNALTENEHDEDFALIYDMGATAVRLAHYPQAEYFYKLCDRYGIVVWAEIPFVDEVGGSGAYENPDETRKEFFRTTKSQLKELISQNFNRPSIVCWGLQNEVKTHHDEVMIPFMNALYDLGKQEDPYRLLTQATNQTTANNWKSDLMNWNVYPGWYGMSRKKLGRFIDKNREGRPMGISEYGAGGNHKQHEERPRKVKHDGQWHPEEYQTLCHEAFIKQINERPYLWATFVWNMFDFGSDGRNEGARPGMNDKGLVSFDRKVKKDSYYLYQSNWSVHPMVQIAESRSTERKKRRTKIKVYSNLNSVTLYNNGKKIKALSKASCKQKGIFLFKIKLAKGRNELRAEAGEIKSSVTFTY